MVWYNLNYSFLYITAMSIAAGRQFDKLRKYGFIKPVFGHARHVKYRINLNFQSKLVASCNWAQCISSVETCMEEIISFLKFLFHFMLKNLVWFGLWLRIAPWWNRDLCNGAVQCRGCNGSNSSWDSGCSRRNSVSYGKRDGKTVVFTFFSSLLLQGLNFEL